MNLAPHVKARDLTNEALAAIPHVIVTFKYDVQARYGFSAKFVLVGKKNDRDFHIDIAEHELMLVFPEMSPMAIRNAGELTKRMPLRLTIGTSTNNNTLGYYGRYELIINNAARNVIHGIVPNIILEFICENYKKMNDYIIWRNGVKAIDVLKALENQIRSK